MVLTFRLAFIRASSSYPVIIESDFIIRDTSSVNSAGVWSVTIVKVASVSKLLRRSIAKVNLMANYPSSRERVDQ